MKHLIALSTIAVALNAHAVMTSVNSLGENGTSASLSLQGILNASGNTLLSVDTHQYQAAPTWSALGNMSISLVDEVAGYASNNKFGIYNAANPLQKYEIFGGSAGAGATMEDCVSPFSTFGFYLENTAVGFTWYSDSSLHGGSNQSVAYQGQGEMLNFGGVNFNLDSNSLLIAWEDIGGGGDQDYNDMIIAIRNLKCDPPSVPDTASTASLLAFAFVGFGLFARRRRA